MIGLFVVLWIFWIVIYLFAGVFVVGVWAHLNGVGAPKDYNTKFFAGIMVFLWPFLLLGYVFMVPFLVLGTAVEYFCKEDPK